MDLNIHPTFKFLIMIKLFLYNNYNVLLYDLIINKINTVLATLDVFFLKGKIIKIIITINSLKN